jgi:hypothetical protein
MGNEVEKFDATADLQPMFGPNPYVGNASYSSDLPDYLEAVPPYGPTDSFKDTIDRVWSHIVRWPRYGFKALMWVTYTFWRFLYVVGTVALLVLLITNR